MDASMLAELARDPFVQTGALAAIGVLVTQGLLRRYPAQRLIFQFVCFAGLTALLYSHDIVPYVIAPSDTPPFERIFLALAKTIWWANAAWVLTSFTRIFLIFEKRPHESRLMQDVIVGVIYLGGVLSVFAYVFNVPVGTLIATSGVFAVILGLALQSTLADVFSGVALNLSRAYNVGDWIVLSDGTQGRIIETNWRGTSLLNAANDLVVLPNSSLAKAQVTNISSPNRSHGVTLTVRMMPTMSPATILAVMRNVLVSSNAILVTPEPAVEIKSLDAQAIEFELSFRVRDFEAASVAKNEVYDLIYRHARASGLMLAPPKGAVGIATSLAPQGTPVAPKAAALRLLETLPLLASLTDTEKQTLAETMIRKTYRKGEVLVEEGAPVGSLTVIRTGVVVVSCHSEEGELELRRLAPGDYFGESALVPSAWKAATVRALTFTVVYEIGQAALMKLMQDRPGIADEVRQTLSQYVKGNMSPAANDGAADMPPASALVSRMRQLFQIARA